MKFCEVPLIFEKKVEKQQKNFVPKLDIDVIKIEEKRLFWHTLLGWTGLPESFTA